MSELKASSTMQEVAPVVPSLGVGVSYQPKMQPFIEKNLDLLDFLEVVPDMCWTNFGAGAEPQYVYNQKLMSWLNEVNQQIPIVPHSIGLSIGSAHCFKQDHVQAMERWFNQVAYPWHSDHLAYNLAEHGDTEVNVGVTMPIEQDQAALERLIPRVQTVTSSIDAPFALENNVYFFKYDQEEFNDAQFLNTLMEQSGCYLILDLHNLYTNALNHAVDPYEFLSEIALDRVIEIHTAGGMEHDGFYLDAHSGPSPDKVVELLEYTLPRCPNIGGINFEILGSWFEKHGSDAIHDELNKLKAIWNSYSISPQQKRDVA